MQLKPALNLLPNYYKKVGAMLIVAIAFTTFLVAILKPNITPHTKEIIKLALSSTFLLALAIIGLSKDRKEDELTHLLRVKSMAITFAGSIVGVITYPFANLIVDNSVKKLSSFELLFIMLLVYLAFFNSMKRSR